MGVMEYLEEQFYYIDDCKPDDGEIVIGYCEPMYEKDFEASVTFCNGEFYHLGRTVRCYHWKRK